MTSAELKTIRESLGLTAQWLADRVNVSLRTIRYWESGKSDIPLDVISQIEHLQKNFLKSVNTHVKEIKIILEKTKPEFVVLLRYRTDEDLWSYQTQFHPMPTTFHAQISMRVKSEFSDKNVRIVYFDPENYETWLSGKEDNSAKRAEWASVNFTDA